MNLQDLKHAVEQAEAPSLWRFKVSYSGGRIDRARPVIMAMDDECSPASFFIDAVKDSVSALGEELADTPGCVMGEGQCIVRERGNSSNTRIEEMAQPIIDNAVADLKDLQNTKYYCVKFNGNGNPVYAFKWIGAIWSKKNTSLNSFFLKEGSLKQLEEDHSFRITKSFDAIVYGEKEFVINPDFYSKIFDYKEDLVEMAVTACTELVDLGVVTDSEKIKEYIGSNALLLKRLAGVVQKGFYKDQSFMDNLKANNRELKFNFLFDGDKVVPEEGKVAELLTALGDRRLKSLNSGNMYDANSTQVVE